GRVDLAFELSRALEFVPVPEFDGGQPEGQSFRGDGQAGMHQYAAQCVMAQTPFTVATAIDALGETHVMRVTALVGELGGILQEQDRAAGRRVPGSRGIEMTAQDIALLDPWIGEEPIGCLRAGPVL